MCSRLKSDPKTKHIPVLHVSATGEFDSDLPEALAHDSDGYLREPIEPATLVATVRALIHTAEDRDRWRRSEARYRRFLEQAYEGVWVVDGTGRTEYVNARMAEMLKCPQADQLIGRSAFDFVPTGDSNLLKAQFASRLAGDARERYEVRLRCFDGSVLWASVSGSNVFDHEGAAVGRMALFTDIADRKRDEEVLRESQQRLELALEAAELGTFELDLVSRTVTASQRTCAMFGFDRAPATPEDWIARIHPEDRERVASELQTSIAGPARFDTANRVLRQNGSMVWVVARAVPVMDTTGRAVRLVGVAQDVTSQRQDEQVRERERGLLRAIIDNIPVMLCLYDPRLNTFELNQEFQRVLGWSTQEANAGDFLAKVYPDPSYKRGAIEYMQSLAPGWRDMNATAKNGERVASEWANIRLADDRMIGIGIDTRERMAARDELLRAVQLHEQQFRMFDGVASTTPDFVYLFDRQGRFLYANRRLLEVWGMELRDVIGKTCRELGYEQWHHDMHMREIAQVIETKTPIKGEVPFKAPLTGIFGVYEYIFSPVLGPDGEVETIAGTTRDVTDRKRVEESLRSANEQLTRVNHDLEQFAYSASHDLQEPLRNVSAYSQLLHRRYAGTLGDDGEMFLGYIVDGAQRMGQLLSDLLAYTRAGSEDDAPVALTDCEAVLERVVAGLDQTVQHTRAVITHSRLPSLCIYPGHMQQVFQNLIGNALKYRKEGEAPRVHVHAEAQNGAWQFSITDNGIGIAPEYHERIFGMFKRLHSDTEKYSGTGMGLAICQRIIERYGGRVWVESDVAAGSTFRFTFPIARTSDATTGPLSTASGSR